MTRADWLLLVAVIACLPLVYARFWLPGGTAAWLEIQAGNEPARVVSLSPDRELVIPGPLGESRIEISQGRARFLSSPCHGKVCVHTGWLQRGGEVAACLPNRVSIQLLAPDPSYDAVNY